MLLERWGSLAVDDHRDGIALATNVLLYDRLVIPVMTEQSDRHEEAYWRQHGWEPGLQRRRIDQLGDLAVRRPWDKARRAIFASRHQQLVAERQDSEDIAKHITRRILAEEPVETNSRAEVIAAYNSLATLRQDYDLKRHGDAAAAQALLLARRLAVPDRNPEDSLAAAIDLSRAPEFREQRSRLFDWQEAAIERGLTPQEAVAYLTDLTQKYNAMVAKAAGKYRLRLAFTLAGAGLAAATMDAIGAASAALALVQFATFEGKPVIEEGSLAPVAMFYDIDNTLGFKLR
jgi:hypothetical protein